jgi:predicted GH43/DUF377 family glycosyl hydrolase
LRLRPNLIVPALALLGIAYPGRAAAAAHAAARQQPPSAEEGVPTMFAQYPYRPKEFAFFYAEGLFHLIYMRHNYTAPHLDSTEVDFGHAVSQNLTQWAQLDPILHVRPGKWDDLHVWAPNVIWKDGVYYLYYTGVTRVPFPYPWYQRIGLATSTDLVNWQRYDAPVFDGNRVPWALADSSRFAGCQFRDAFVMEDPGSSENWLMYYSTTPAAATTQLIAGVGSNRTGASPWQDVMPLWNTNAAHFQGYIESSHVFAHDGRWYLFFTTNSGHPIRFQHASSPTADSTGWVGTYRLFDNEPDTDQWFASEFLKVGEHEYFAAVNSGNRGIEIREMVWSGTTTFRLVKPSVEGLSGPDRGAEGLSLVALEGGRGAAEMKFRVTLPSGMKASIGVYDVAGRRIRALSAGAMPGGETVVSWDRRDGAGHEVGAGIYLVRLETPVGSRSASAPVLR